MPDLTPPADGTTGEGGGNPAPQSQQAPPVSKTFSQEDVDRIVQERLARQGPKAPDDYEAAKAALDRENQRKENEKTEVQKLTDALTASNSERDEARAETGKVRREAAIMLEAIAQGADAEMVILALAEDASIKLSKDGTVEGAKEAVTALLEKKPHLKVGTTTRSGGEFGGKDSTTVAEEIAALEKKGDPESIRQARDLKIAQFVQGG